MTAEELIHYYQTSPPNPPINLHYYGYDYSTYTFAILVDFFVYETNIPEVDPVQAVIFAFSTFFVIPPARLSIPQ